MTVGAWRMGRFMLTLERPRVMGIVNVTPDSFSGDGRSAHSALKHCEQLLREGADILDIGGESTRPQARPVSLEEELTRIVPVVTHAVSLGVPISVDTSRAVVIECVLGLGADVINDVRALQLPGALQAVARHSGVGVCLMHMAGDPATMQTTPAYDDVVKDVSNYLQQRVLACVAAGIDRDRLGVDPGIGFGKLAQHNLQLLRRQRELLALGQPLLVGWSRKSTLGEVTGRPVDQRLGASLGAALAAVHAGAHVVRVHDVAATVDALKTWHAATMP